MYYNYIFDKEEISLIKIDLNFIDGQQAKQNVLWVKDQLKIFPEIKPLIQILKRFLQVNKLNCSFDGKFYFFKI